MASLHCWRCCVVIFNVISAISGLVLFGASSFLLYRLLSYRQFIGGNVDGPAIALLCMGLITCVVSYVCWRSIYNIRKPQILLYSVILFAGIVAEFTCFVWALVVWENLEIHLKMTMDDYFLSATHGKDEYSIAKWDRIQNDMKCCGPGGPGDYRAAQIVPWSCCSSSAGPHSPDCGTVYQRGCIKPVYEYARAQLLYVALAGLAAALVQILGLVLTCCFLNSIGLRSDRSRNEASDYHPPELSSTLLANNSQHK